MALEKKEFLTWTDNNNNGNQRCSKSRNIYLEDALGPSNAMIVSVYLDNSLLKIHYISLCTMRDFKDAA